MYNAKRKISDWIEWNTYGLMKQNKFVVNVYKAVYEESKSCLLKMKYVVHSISFQNFFYRHLKLS